MAKFLKGKKSFQNAENLFGRGYDGGNGMYNRNIFVNNNNRNKNMGGKYFGKRLDPNNEKSIPPFLSQLYEYLRGQGRLNTENLFREEKVEGKKESYTQELVDEVIEILDDAEEEDLEFEEIIEALENDPYSAAMVIKLYFRQMPEPALSFALYDEWVLCGKIQDKIAMKSKMKKLLKKLDKTTLKLLRDLFKLLFEVASHSKCNLMTTEILSLVFSPNILRPKVLELTTFKDLGTICNLVQVMIENHVELL